MQSKSYLFLLLVLALAGLSGWQFATQKPQYGLDVRGGIRLTLEIDASRLPAKDRARMEEIRANVVRILTNRAGTALGVVEAPVQLKGENQVIVELPGATDANQARQILSSTARIECYHAKTVATQKIPYRKYQIDKSDTTKDKPSVQFRLTSDPTKVLTPGMPEYEEMIKSWEIILAGEDLKSAGAESRGVNDYIPRMEFSSEGAKKIEAWSRRTMNMGEHIAFVLDKNVLSIAPLKDGTILSDNAIIDGTFDTGYVRALTNLLNAGSLPVDLKELSSQKVDPSIGAKAFDQMILAGMIALGFTAIFLIVYYLFPGFVALIALALYILFSIALLKVIGATFSLSAIAGFILSVGMAVDANILVFERLKEELRSGRQLKQAIELGFKRALPAIIDSNACTILTSFVLMYFGTGPVKGFASTLILGVLISLFTAVTVTRSLLVFLVGSGLGAKPSLYAANRQWFLDRIEAEGGTKPFKVMEKTKLWFIISIGTIIPGAIFIAMGGLKLNVEFQGGFEAEYRVQAGSNLTSSQIISNLEAKGIKGANVKFAQVGSEKRAYVTVPESKDLKIGDPAGETRLAEAAGFKFADQSGFSKIGPSIQAETVRNAIYGVVLSSLLIVMYLAIRFGTGLGGFAVGFRFGLSAIGALAHDVLVVLGVAAIVGYFAGWEVSALFLTAMLTVIGFSVHDTIVIFDRIRENLSKSHGAEDFTMLCNKSVTQSFARSIMTSMTVIATLIILAVMGTPTPDLKFFSVAMLVGVLSGTYSSIYNATPILWLWDNAIVRKHGSEASLVFEAQREVARQRELAASMGIQEPGSNAYRDEQGKVYSQVKRRRNSEQERGTQIIDD